MLGHDEKQPSVSVIIPVHNGAPFIRSAVESVFAQSVKVTECIIVNDGSKDDTETIVSRYGDRVRLYSQNQQGVAAARNRGIALSSGSHIAFLDADDVWLTRKIEAQLDTLRTYGADAVVCRITVTNENLERTDEDGGTIGGDLRGLLKFECSGGGGSTLLATREVLSRVGGYHPELSTSADWDILAQIALIGQVAVVDEPLVLYRKHESNMHRNVLVMERDMNLAFRRVFDDPRLDKKLKADERKIRSVLHRILAGSYYKTGCTAAAGRHAVRAAILSPTATTKFVLLAAAKLLGKYRKAE